MNGVGQSPNADDNSDAFLHLNMMLAQWNKKRPLIYHLLDKWAASTGDAVMTVGPGGVFDMPRTDRIDAAFSRFITQYGGATLGEPVDGFVIGVSQVGPEAQGVDFPITVLYSREDYNSAMTKGVFGAPYYAFFDSDWPMGKLHLYPVPQAGVYEIHITVKAELTQFPDLTTDINLPPEYLEALLYNLAVRLRFSYQLPPDAKLEKLASAALTTIMGANAQIPMLGMPSALSGRRGRINIYTGV